MYIVSQKWTPQKKNNLYFLSTFIDAFDKETTPILLFHHTYYKEKYILSNIYVDHGTDEKQCFTTINDLYKIKDKKNKVFHKKWIKIE